MKPSLPSQKEGRGVCWDGLQQTPLPRVIENILLFLVIALLLAGCVRSQPGFELGSTEANPTLANLTPTGTPFKGQISIDSVEVDPKSFIRAGGMSALPDGACILTQLLQEYQPVPWWPVDTCANVQMGRWDIQVILRQSGYPEQLDPNAAYNLLAWYRQDPEIEADPFPFDLQGPPTPIPAVSPSPTTPPQESPLAGLKPPGIVYILGDQVVSQTAGGEPQTLATLPGGGEVKATLENQDRLFVLHTDSLQRVDLVTGSTQVLERFSQPVLWGEFLATPEGDQVVAAATVNSSCSDTGMGAIIGIYPIQGETGKTLLTPENSVWLLGNPPNDKTLYLQPVGCDPSFGEVWRVSLESGEIEAKLPTPGENFRSLSPDGRYLATLNYKTASTDQPPIYLLGLYDLSTDLPQGRTFELPEQPGNILQLAWSPDSRRVYFTWISADPNYAAEEESLLSYGLWRLDVPSGSLAEVAPGAKGALPWLDTSGHWALLRHSWDATAYLVNLDTTDIQELNLPDQALIETNITGTEPLSLLSPDGKWLLVWQQQGSQAWLVHLGSSAAGALELPSNAHLVGWED
jgi:hypothetical protein